ncbi:MAG: PAS domain S-box protein, partial [Chloroflexota bacterium]
ALRESEKLLREMAANYPNSYISIVEKDLTIGFTSGQEFKKQGLDPDSFVGLTLEQVFGEQTPVVREHYLKAFGGVETEFELFINGQHQLYRAVPLAGDDGAIDSILAVVENITERKRADEALRESEELFRQVYEYMEVGVARVSLDFRIQSANQAYCRMLGYSEAELAGRHLRDITHPETLEENLRKQSQLAAGEIDHYRMEKRFIHRDGHVVHGILDSSLIRDAQGKPAYFLGSVLDITERRQVEEQLALYTERLEELVDERTRELREAHEQLVRQERLATLGQLAGSIGHELRNPLGVIANAVYFLKLSQPGAGDKVREYLDIIDNETRASDKIVTDLLDYTRVKSLDQAPVSVSAAAQATLERYPAPPPVEVTLDLPPDLPPALADPRHVEQILGNLVVNACQAMTDGGKLTIAAGTEGDMIFISVKDTGIGIPPENLDKIFEPLFTTKSRGIGLGLAVSQKLAQANGGRIAVQSASSPQGEAGAGSVFTLYLPVYKETK